jgi:hypothetical protein
MVGARGGEEEAGVTEPLSQRPRPLSGASACWAASCSKSRISAHFAWPEPRDAERSAPKPRL